MELKEDSYQRKLGLQGFLDNSKLFKEDLDDAIAFADAELASDIKGFVTAQKHDKLNFDLGRKAGLEMVLNLLQNYADDLTGESVKSRVVKE